MKYNRFFGAFLLVITISACSSGSSDEPEASTSTNTVPTQDNSTDAGESSGPTDDQPTTAGDNGTDSADDGNTLGTDGGTDSADGSDTDGVADTAGGDTDGQTDASGGTDTNGETDASGGNDTNGQTDASDGSSSDGSSDSDGSADTDGGTDTSGASDSGDDGGTDGSGGSGGSDGGGDGTSETNPDPIIDPASALGQMQSRIDTLTRRALLAFNQLLSQGEMLTAQEEQCLGSFDPAFGEPLLSIDCEQPWATGDVEIFAGLASLVDTPECRASLQDAKAEECVVDQAEFIVRPMFIVPEVGTPQPTIGAMLSYNTVQDRLKVENLTPALTGTFLCEYDLTNGQLVDGSQGGNCDSQLNNIADLIDDYLSTEH